MTANEPLRAIPDSTTLEARESVVPRGASDP